MTQLLLHTFAQIKNCPDGGTNCFTNLPDVAANQSSLDNFLTIVFGTLAAIAVLIIVLQGIRFSLSSGDPQKAADARKGIIYAVIGLIVSVSADVLVKFVIGRL